MKSIMPNVQAKTVTIKGVTYEIVDGYLRGVVAELSPAIQQLDNDKANVANTLDGYGITDAYTKAEVDNAIGVKADSLYVGNVEDLNTSTKTNVVAAINEHEVEVNDIIGRVEALEYYVENNSDYHGNPAEISTLKTFAEAVYNNTVFDSIGIGDQITLEWNDNNTIYDAPWFFCDVEQVELEDASVIPAADVEWEYTIPYDIPFDSPEAIYESDRDTPAGTYYFRITNDNFGPDSNKYVQFTLPDVLPAGYQIRKSTERGLSVLSGTLDIYSGAGSTVKQYSVTPTEGSNGTYLGETNGEGNLNLWSRVCIGDSRWRYSNVRQYLNKTEGKGLWWSKQKKWDVKPACANQIDAFLHGYSAAMLEYFQETKVFTRYSSGVIDETYDKVFISSLEQMYIAPEYTNSEGDPWGYYRALSESADPISRSQGSARLIKYAIDDQNVAQSYPLRSVSMTNTNGTWSIQFNGVPGTYYSDRAFKPVPCARISLPESQRGTGGNDG